ncbi:unnamed protein product [Spirodela intermedia]|uniref:Uncharacterized protein n=1 Tax=Spirodela intermedia TaxID=51605 RepID=A0A7I8JM19_SPIIN|nr:unnamed protein product [Spirodela intermedia]CAA6671208.1 unnamed protein product [Spirodela intermedia]
MPARSWGTRPWGRSGNRDSSDFCPPELRKRRGNQGITESPRHPSVQGIDSRLSQQDLLRERVIVGDDFCWAWGDGEGGVGSSLRYVGGVDVSFAKDDPSIACGALVVKASAPGVIHEVYDVARLTVPYVPGFLAFREAPILLRLLEKMKRDAPLSILRFHTTCFCHDKYFMFRSNLFMMFILLELSLDLVIILISKSEISYCLQVLMVDGNGVLHPRGFGLACHLGVLANLPTIGIGKNLHHVDGLTLSRVRKLLQDPANISKDLVTLMGDSGRIWGAAMRSSSGSSKPIFVSVGHRLSLESCISIVRMCCKHRVPEPIRQADIRSRRHLLNTQGTTPE